MGKLLVVLAIALSLVGCEKRVVTNSTRIGMEVVAVDLRSKSNSTVDLRILGTNLVYHDLRLSCRRDDAANVRIGSKWDVVVEDYRYGDRHGTEVKGTSAICDKSQ